MSSDSPNPYNSPGYHLPPTVNGNPIGINPAAVSTGPAPPPFTGMQYLRSYQFIFEHSQWLANVALVFVCYFLIPVVGPIVGLGYFSETLEHLHTRQPNGPYPTFAFGRFGDYLKRGVWPFVGVMLASLMLLPVAIVALFGVGLISAVVGENGSNSEVLAALLFIMAGILYFAAILALNLAMIPVLIATEITQELSAATNFRWHRDFLGRVWKETLLTVGFLIVSSLGLTLLGAALCCVGIYPLTTPIFFAQTHLNYQLYELYLSRGGQPLTLKSQLPPTL
ncbi:MAG: DUF4013 domain-containing protein [Planctomycetota bacterium]